MPPFSPRRKAGDETKHFKPYKLPSPEEKGWG